MMGVDVVAPAAAEVSQRVVAAITEARKARGWTAQRLSDECAIRAGLAISRGVIAKLESGERKQITVSEWLALSSALGLSPIPPESSKPVVAAERNPQMHERFTTMLAAGFTERQACWILGAMLADSDGQGPA